MKEKWRLQKKFCTLNMKIPSSKAKKQKAEGKAHERKKRTERGDSRKFSEQGRMNGLKEIGRLDFDRTLIKQSFREGSLKRAKENSGMEGKTRG